MLMFDRPMQLRWTVAPGDSAILPIWDSTRGPSLMSQAAVASGSAYLIPGPWKGKFPRVIVSGRVRPTGQDVTLKFYVRTEYDGDANDWEADVNAPGGGSIAITASATQPFEWLTEGEHLVRVDAGATGPTTLICDVVITPTMDYGT